MIRTFTVRYQGCPADTSFTAADDSAEEVTEQVTEAAERHGVTAGIAEGQAARHPVQRVENLRGRGGRGRAVDRTVLRFGVRPFLLLADVLAWAVVVVPGTRPTGRELVLLLLVLAAFSAAGLYRSRLSLSSLDDLPALVGRVLAAAAVASSLTLLLMPAAADGSLLTTGALLAVVILLLRRVAYGIVNRFRSRGWVSHPTLILGAGRIGGQLAGLLQDNPCYGLRPVGFLDEDPLLDPSERPVPLLGGPESLAGIMLEFGVRDVVVAFGSAPESQMVDIIRTCDRLDAEIFFVPRLFELHHTSKRHGRGVGDAAGADAPGGVPHVLLAASSALMDVVLSALALVALSPLLAADRPRRTASRAVPASCSARSGWAWTAGRSQLLKFRSLKPVDETESAVMLEHRSTTTGWGRSAASSASTSLDELAQLWNILRGDMTIVGPRPERPHFVESFTSTFPRYMARHRVPAGLTGWAQVHGLRGDTSIEDRARFDNYYIENWSLWADVKIILRTVTAVLKRTGG